MIPAMLLYFLGASAALTVAPGPDNIFVLTQGIARGRRPAIVTALGMCSGISVHTTAAALGISAVFYSSALAFSVVKYAGAAYLLYLAFRTLRDRSAVRLAGVDERPAAALFKRGFIMNVLNPKVAMFFLAFLPQFVDPNVAHPALQVAFLGLLFMALGLVTDSLWAVVAGTAGGVLRRSARYVKIQRYVAGSVYVGLGVATALVGAED